MNVPDNAPSSLPLFWVRTLLIAVWDSEHFWAWWRTEKSCFSRETNPGHLIRVQSVYFLGDLIVKDLWLADIYETLSEWLFVVMEPAVSTTSMSTARNNEYTSIELQQIYANYFNIILPSKFRFPNVFLR